MQKVKGQGHTQSKIDLVAWRIYDHIGRAASYDKSFYLQRYVDNPVNWLV